MSEEKKKGSLGPIFFIMAVSVLISLLWNQLPFIKNSIGAVLNPTFGALVTWNVSIGALIIVFLMTLFTTLIQKYTTDQKALKLLKEEQKKIQEEMKKFRDDPNKVSELSKKNMELIPQTFRLTSRSLVITGIPLILFYRWFNDIFTALGNPLIFGFMGWFVFYLISAMIFSSVFRKVLKVA
jgi:uncharacterized membrane protein (DUF106 family)